MAIKIDVALDTNILLRTTFDRPAQPTVEFRAVHELRRQGLSLGTTTANLAEFANVATRPVEANGLGLTVLQAQQRIWLFETYFAIYAESLESFDIWKQLVTTYAVKGKSVHDARIVAVMLRSQIPAILTSNTSHFARFREITVFHPVDVLRRDPS